MKRNPIESIKSIIKSLVASAKSSVKGRNPAEASRKQMLEPQKQND
jgi:hypothetical protein